MEQVIGQEASGLPTLQSMIRNIHRCHTACAVAGMTKTSTTSLTSVHRVHSIWVQLDFTPTSTRLVSPLVFARMFSTIVLVRQHKMIGDLPRMLGFNHALKHILAFAIARL
jgi:hypothetical protein